MNDTSQAALVGLAVFVVTRILNYYFPVGHDRFGPHHGAKGELEGPEAEPEDEAREDEETEGTD